MTYVVPADLVARMVDAGEAKVRMAAGAAFLRAFMAGAILALSAAFAVTVSVQTGHPIVGAILFPVGFCMLYLLGYDLLTGVFALTPLALLDRRDGVTCAGILRHWAVVFGGNLAGALLVAGLMSVVLTYGFSAPPNAVGRELGHIGVARTLGYAEHGWAGWLTVFVRGALCNWMVSTGVVGAMISSTVGGKVIAMWMPIMLFFYMTFEHSIVNMFLFPSGLLLGAHFTLVDYLIWNEIPTVLGNLVGGLSFTGLTLYATHLKTAPKRAIA